MQKIRRYNTKGAPTGSLEERFWRKVNKNGQDDCWEWTGAVSCSGYGVLQKGSRGQGIVRAHRLSLEIHKGKIPENALVLHSCDNKLCCNPSHLSIGDYSRNIKEAYERKRRCLTDWQLRGFAKIRLRKAKK